MIGNFINSLALQSKAILDGPLAHYTSYTFALNKVVLALLLSIVLVFDFTINLPSWGNFALRITGLISVALSLSGFVFIISQLRFTGNYKMFFVELVLFQFAYFLISLVVLGKSYEAKWSYMNFMEKTDA